MLILKVNAAPSGSAPVMVNVVGVSSLVVIDKLFTVGGCGAGSLLVGEEQVQMKIKINIMYMFFISNLLYIQMLNHQIKMNQICNCLS